MRAFCIINKKLYLVRWLVKSNINVVEVKTRIVEAKSKWEAVMTVCDQEIANARTT